MYPLQLLSGDVQPGAEASEETNTAVSSYNVAQTDPAYSPQEGREEGRNEMEVSFEDKIAREREECFIRDRQSYDSKGQEDKNSRVTVLCNPDM